MAVDFPKCVVHGGTGKQQQEKLKKMVLDFSASVNPFPPQFDWECKPECLTNYPDNNYQQLKDQIARAFHRDADECCVGNGSIELIRVFCSVALSEGKRYSIETPTFGEYELSAQLAGATRTQSPHDAAVSFICNPNNPTGHLRTKNEMLTLLTATARSGVLFVDEAFIELSAPRESLIDVRDDRLFLLRSLTKSFAVPGLRFGYGFGDPTLIEKIEVARPPWSVNAYAEAFAMQAFSHMDALAKSREMIIDERNWLSGHLSAIGLRCHPSSVNYLLVETGRAAAPLALKLEKLGILVRDCTSFELPTCIRIAVRTRDENTILIEALTSCVQ
ncbi:MAG: histidinol-phosphate transaminase [Methanoregula sp.]|nr:histidinol-phosphate transaminase [Methanoregula sp.]